MIFDFENCGGCKTCELSCSFERTGAFNHHCASMRVIENERTYRVEFFEKDEGDHKACDGCAGLEEPLCATYCHDPDQMKKLVEKFMEHMSQEEKR
jgi:Fe-S-cluster-containing hydrogenase component 2